MRDLLYFDSMVTPKIITFVYWLMLIGVTIAGLGMIFSGTGIMGVLGGLLTIALGALVIRIYCELLIVLFKIHENLKKVADSKGL
jgi:hypothetical protein